MKKVNNFEENARIYMGKIYVRCLLRTEMVAVSVFIELVVSFLLF